MLSCGTRSCRTAAVVDSSFGGTGSSEDLFSKEADYKQSILFRYNAGNRNMLDIIIESWIRRIENGSGEVVLP